MNIPKPRRGVTNAANTSLFRSFSLSERTASSRKPTQGVAGVAVGWHVKPPWRIRRKVALSNEFEYE